MPDRARPERPDVATGPVVWSALGFLAFVGLALAGLLIYFRAFVPGHIAVAPDMFAAPRLQVAPRADRADLQAKQAAQLRGYAWIDRSAGTARIPIEDAMAILAAKGPAAYDPPGQAPASTPEAKP